jgi:hypothetical protein
MQRIRIPGNDRMKIAAAPAVVVFVGGGTGIAQVRSAASRTAADDALTLHIASPSADAQVTQPFEVQLDSNVGLGAPESGLHHVHLYYDTTTPDGEYVLVYGNTAQVTGVAPGVHTILASLRNANHSDAGPRELITVTVADTADGAAMQAAGQRATSMPDMNMPVAPQPDYGY